MQKIYPRINVEPRIEVIFNYEQSMIDNFQKQMDSVEDLDAYIETIAEQYVPANITESIMRDIDRHQLYKKYQKDANAENTQTTTTQLLRRILYHYNKNVLLQVPHDPYYQQLLNYFGNNLNIQSDVTEIGETFDKKHRSFIIYDKRDNPITKRAVIANLSISKDGTNIDVEEIDTGITCRNQSDYYSIAKTARITIDAVFNQDPEPGDE